MIKEIIYQELKWLFGPKSAQWQIALSELAEAFVNIGHYKRGDILWSPGDQPNLIYFNTTGIIGEFIPDTDEKDEPCLDFIPPQKLFWNGNAVLFQEPTQTSMRVLHRTQIWAVSMEDILNILSQHNIEIHASSVMIQHQLRVLSDRVREMLNLKPAERLQRALERHPYILHAVPRHDLSSYLGISRATLFRVMNQLYHQ